MTAGGGTPTQRVAAVLREHGWSELHWACKCGERHIRLAQHPDHQAQAVIDALQLTEERADNDDNTAEYVRRVIRASTQHRP